MVEPLQSVTAILFVASFLTGAYLHDVFASVGILAVIYYSTFFASDFSFAPPNVNVFYHVWSVALILAASMAGYFFATALKYGPLVSLQRGGDKIVKLSTATLAAHIHVLAVATTTFGINAWLRRTQVASGGLYPIGTDLVSAGIAATVIGIVVLVATTIVLVASKYIEFNRTAKYIWLLPLVPATLVINDIGAFNWKYQVGMFVAFVAMWGIVLLLTIFAPTRHANEADPFYHKKTYSLIFVGFSFLITLIALLLHFSVCVWPSSPSSLQTGMIVMLSYSGLIMVASIFASLAISTDKAKEWGASDKFYSIDVANAGAYMGVKGKQISLKDRFAE